jgi:hypothetical protein
MTGGQRPKPRKAEKFHTARLVKTPGIECELDKARGSDGYGVLRADAAVSSVVLSAHMWINWIEVCKFLSGAFFVNAGILFYFYLIDTRSRSSARIS